MARTTKRLKAVVIGCGWGLQHMRGFDASEHAQLAAVWSRSDKPDARAAAARFRVPLYHDLEKMLAEVKPDLVGVASPESAHEAHTLAALEHGAHVHCEKVLADTADQARRMIAKAREQKRLLNVGYNYRYSVSCKHLAKVVASGGIGRPLFAQLWAFTWCLHHLTDFAVSLLGTPARAIGQVDLDPLPGRPHKSIRAPGHLFPTFTYAAYTKKVYTVEFDNGALLQAASTDYTEAVEPGGRLLVQGDAGRVEMDDLSGKVTLWRGTREATVFTPSQIRDPIGLTDNGSLAAQDFARAVALGEPAPIPGEQGLAMILLEEAVFRSTRSRKWEAIEV